MSYLIKLICIMISILPETRLFKFKVFLLNLCGFKFSQSSRIVSSISIVGTAKLTVLDGSYLGHFFKCYGDGVIRIGSEVDIGPEVSIVTGTHTVNVDGGKVAGEGRCEDVFIGDNCWICTGVKILGGTVIGNDSLVAPGSVVKGTFSEGAFIGGNPAKEICKLKDLYNKK
ncbi:acyltransferase [Parashewanella curva]|uniref:Acyltransferase n=1 Tax=Parashewanella curva TaxID=2338552 RepID=A0A3L8PY59_9GAMM|nr:acyltransferase [Parashewanella curva]RLV60387.1 acyltransferase [Parashewanella curva]